MQQIPALSESVRPQAHAKIGFRADIAGLRAVAVVAVVVFHAGVTVVPGGFAGVDVFFVISGFLITSLLLRELEATHSIDLRRFWARRIRRLVPAAAVMVLVTSIATLAIVSALNFTEIMRNALASALYVSNVVFAIDGSDYFAEDLNVPNPFLHTWTLGVEEQFYIFLPILVVTCALIARKQSRFRARHLLLVALIATLILSVYLSVRYSETRPDLAFYLLPTRMWEFCIGGLLAFAPAALVRRRVFREVVAIVGVLVLAFAFLALDSSTVYPGIAAAVPALGAAAVILAGMRSSSVDLRPSITTVLSIKPLAWVGDISYSLYLWHWPTIVLVPFLLPEASRGVQMAIAVSAAIMLAVASYYLIENPVRFSPRLSRGNLRSFIVGFGFTTIAAGVAVVGLFMGFRAEAANPELVEAREVAVEEGDDVDLVDRARRELTSAAEDEVTVLLVGDSHARHWKESFEAASTSLGYSLSTITQGSCPAIDIVTVNTKGAPTGEGCVLLRERTKALIEEVRPDIVVLSIAEGYLGRIVSDSQAEIDEEAQLTLWRHRYSSWLSEVSPHAGVIGVIVDNPRFEQDPNECLARSENPQDCDVPRAEAFEQIVLIQSESAAARAESPNLVAREFSITDEICDELECRVFDNGLPVFRDYNHLARRWTMTQVPRIEDFLIDLREQPSVRP